jgi:hypothetical protein
MRNVNGTDLQWVKKPRINRMKELKDQKQIKKEIK